jgi:glycine/D-amino acid oxidase-like deaminating enzyme
VTTGLALSPDLAPSLWTSRNPSPPPAPILRGRLEAEIAIVGGGIAGLSTALHLAEAGREVVVLEGAPSSAGAYAASGGIVAPQLVRTTPGKVLGRLGAEGGSRFLRLLAASGRYLFDLIRSEGIDCDARNHGFLNPLAGESGAAHLRVLIEEWAPFRQDLQLAEAEEAARLTGCQGYAACLVDPSGGGLDPVAFVQGMARRLTASSARIFRQSPVSSVVRQGAGWLLGTPQGGVVARQAILCANGGNARLHPALAKTVLPLPVYEVATAPLPRAMREAILPGGQTLTDSSTHVFTIRFDAEGRLITACSALARRSGEALARELNARLAAAIPAYVETPLEYAWMGTAWLNSSLLPRIVSVDQGLFALQACNGRGIGLNAVIGREMARMLEAPGAYEPGVPLERPRPVPGYTFARYVPGLMMAGASLRNKVFPHSS